MTRNNYLGGCVRGPKIVVRIANEQRISTDKTCSPTSVTLDEKKFPGLIFIILPHLKCVDFIFGARFEYARVEYVYSTFKGYGSNW